MENNTKFPPWFWHQLSCLFPMGCSNSKRGALKQSLNGLQPKCILTSVITYFQLTHFRSYINPNFRQKCWNWSSSGLPKMGYQWYCRHSLNVFLRLVFSWAAFVWPCQQKRAYVNFDSQGQADSSDCDKSCFFSIRRPRFFHTRLTLIFMHWELSKFPLVVTFELRLGQNWQECQAQWSKRFLT